MSYEPVTDLETWEWELANRERPHGIDIACCDCGLVHRLTLYKGRTDRHIDIVFETKARQTAARRRGAALKASIARLYAKVVSR